MKKLILILLVFSSTTSFAQEKDKIDSLDFCSFKYKVPKDCMAKSSYEVTGSNYHLGWLYLTKEMFNANVSEQVVSQMERPMKEFQKTPIVVYILKKQVKAYKISFKKDDGIGYQIFAYGIINNQPVMVQLSLNIEPKTNADIPEFPNQIISFTN